MTDAMTEALKKAKLGDKDASEQLIEENSGLIWSIARRFFGRGVEADDRSVDAMKYILANGGNMSGVLRRCRSDEATKFCQYFGGD